MVTAKNEQDSKKKENETESEEKAKAAASEGSEETKDPHEDGGCCGVCG